MTIRAASRVTHGLFAGLRITRFSGKSRKGTARWVGYASGGRRIAGSRQCRSAGPTSGMEMTMVVGPAYGCLAWPML
jgi:hypothetical protein